jgi:hypothetical protein
VHFRLKSPSKKGSTRRRPRTDHDVRARSKLVYDPDYQSDVFAGDAPHDPTCRPGTCSACGMWRYQGSHGLSEAPAFVPTSYKEKEF